MPSENVIVVIPVYKITITIFEEISFRQCLKVLNKHPICIISPQYLDLKVYKDISEEYKVKLIFKYYHDSYFSSINGYNRLLLSRFFYKSFSSYNYMLIYQLDAYVFKDELLYWCSQNWDYIGAPWFENFGTFEKGNKLSLVGNGGFSLRKVNALYDMLNYKLTLKSFNELIKEKNPLTVSSFVYALLKSTGIRNTAKSTIRNYIKENMNEDVFFSKEYNGTNVKLNKPPLEIALKFSFELSPAYLYKLNNYQLPFGCHGWCRINDVYHGDIQEFWKDFIE